MAALQLVLDVVGQFFHPADDAEPDVVGQQRLQLGAQVPLQQHHQRADLGGGAFPVLDRERVQRQHLDAETRGGLDRVANSVDAGAVPFDARKVALRGPPAVAVHDDGDVRRQPIEIDLPDEHFVRVACRNPRQELFFRHGNSDGLRCL